MKLKSIHIILIIILIAVILMLTSSDAVVPYSKDTLFSHMYKYEGMDNINVQNADELFQTYVNKNAKMPEPMSQSDFNNAISSMGGTPKNTEYPSLNEPKEPKKVEGFSLQPAPFEKSQMLDRYVNTPSGSQCFGNSSGYSKSLGPLCLSQEDIRMLSTRGGNISGADSTIGR